MQRIFVCFILFTLVFSGFLYGQDLQTIAVLDFEGFGINVHETQALTNRLRGLLTRAKEFEVVERGKMNDILKEQGFQQTGCTSEECIVEAGQLLGVRFMLSGSIGMVGSTYTIDMRIVDIQDGRVIASSSHDVYGKIDNVLKEGLAASLGKLLAAVRGEVYGVEKASLRIISAPEGADIIVNNESIGLTPVRLEDIPAKTDLVIEVLKEGYVTIKDTVNLAPGNNPSKQYKLKECEGLVTVFGKPENATIRVNSRRIGKTPFNNYNMVIGSYKMLISKPAYKVTEKSFNVTYNSSTTVDYELEPMPKLPPFLLSTLIPGSGQIYQRYKIKGFLLFVASAGLGYMAYDAHTNYTDQKTDWEQKRDIYNSNYAQPELWPSQKTAVRDAYDLMKNSEQKRMIYAGGLGLVWSINILDIIF